MHKIPGVEETETPGVYELLEMAVAENSDHTEEDKYINPDAAFPPLPHPPYDEDKTVIKPNTKQVVAENVLKGDKDPDKDSTNDNGNDNNTITDNGEMEIDDDEVFQPSDPSQPEKCAWKSSHTKLLKLRRLSYIHLHKSKDKFTNVMHHALS